MESATTDHLEEGDVIRILDGEAGEEEIAVFTSHLRSCESCRRLRDEVAQQSSWFHSAVTLLDDGAGADDVTKARALAAIRSGQRDRSPAAGVATPAPHLNGRAVDRSSGPRRGRTLYPLIAAGVGIILFVGLTVEPVRAWIRENVLAVASPVAEPAPEEVVAPTPASPSAASARFAVSGPVFRIELDEHQEEGTLSIRLTTEDQAAARIVGGTEETLIVVPGRSLLRVGNTTESNASYVVELPAGEIREVVVYAGGKPLGSRTFSSTVEEVELDLATEGALP